MNGLALCAGVGGLELGIKLAGPGYRTVCYVEGEAYAASILVSRMEDQTLDTAPIWSDLRSFDGRPWRGLVDIITAGYPCQPFSAAGKRRGADDPRHLWPEVARIIAETGPALVFCENVGAHLSLGFEQVSEDMESLGYRVAAGVFTAWAIGAPHIRERLFWLATYTDVCHGDDPGHGASALCGGRPEAASLSGLPADPDCPRQPQSQGGEPNIWRRPGRRTGTWDWREAPPAVCGVDDGVACELDQGVNYERWREEAMCSLWGDHSEQELESGEILLPEVFWGERKTQEPQQGRDEEKGTTIGTPGPVRGLRYDRAASEASPGSSQAGHGDRALSGVPHDDAHRRGNMGEGTGKNACVCDLRRDVFPREDNHKDVRPEMSRRVRKNECSSSMGCQRVDRIRACGNGVVPQVAARAFVELLGELHE